MKVRLVHIYKEKCFCFYSFQEIIQGLVLAFQMDVEQQNNINLPTLRPMPRQNVLAQNEAGSFASLRFLHLAIGLWFVSSLGCVVPLLVVLPAFVPMPAIAKDPNPMRSHFTSGSLSHAHDAPCSGTYDALPKRFTNTNASQTPHIIHKQTAAS